MSALQLASLNNPSCSPFVEAWLRWRGDALVPSRAQLDLNEIKRELAMVSMVEVRSPDEMVIRVAGSGITPFKGFDLTGMNLKDLTPAKDWPIRRHRIMSVVRHPCGGALLHEGRMGDELIHTVAMVVLPLRPASPDGNPLVLMQLIRTDQPGVSPAEPISQHLPIPDEFSFIDIGAGTPASTEPA